MFCEDGNTTSGKGKAWSSQQQQTKKSQRAVENREKQETGCEIICSAPTTLTVKGLMMMMSRQQQTLGALIGLFVCECWTDYQKKKKKPKSKTRHTTESHLQQFQLSQVRRILQDNLLCYISFSIVLLCSLCAVLSCLHFALFTAYTCSVVCCLASFTANACSVVFCLALFTLCCPVRLSVSPHTFWVCFVHCLRLLSCLLSCSAHCVLFSSTVRLFIMVGTKDKALWHWQWNRTGQTHSFMQLNKFCHSDCKEDHFNQSVSVSTTLLPSDKCTRNVS